MIKALLIFGMLSLSIIRCTKTTTGRDTEKITSVENIEQQNNSETKTTNDVQLTKDPDAEATIDDQHDYKEAVDNNQQLDEGAEKNADNQSDTTKTDKETPTLDKQGRVGLSSKKADNATNNSTQTTVVNNNWFPWTGLIFFIVSIGLTVGIALLVFLSIYYRIYLYKKKIMPFEAPGFLRMFFPKPTNYEHEITVLCSKYIIEEH